MNSTALSEIEEKINKLSREEKLRLIEHISKSLLIRLDKKEDLENQLQDMANDPEIQQELHLINEEFESSLLNGLKKL